ncbi:MAG: SixA phosphatase family protein [Acidimicrobiales bacterium]
MAAGPSGPAGPSRPAGASGGRLLWVLRHAAAVPDPPPGARDRDRPLAPSGRRNAEALGRRLATDRLGLGPDELPSVVLCSTARRTVQTAEGVLAGITSTLDLRHHLYQASPEEVLGEVQTVDDAERSVMVVGHNPTVHRLALDLIATDDEAGRQALVGRTFPTCGLAVYRVTTPRWRDVAPGSGTVATVVAPPYGE